MVSLKNPAISWDMRVKELPFTVNNLLNLYGETAVFKINASPLKAINQALIPSLFWGGLVVMNEDNGLKTTLKVPEWLRYGAFNEFDYWAEFTLAVNALSGLISGEYEELFYRSWDEPEEVLTMDIDPDSGCLVVFLGGEYDHYSYRNSEINTFLSDYFSLLPGGWVEKPSRWVVI